MSVSRRRQSALVRRRYVIATERMMSGGSERMVRTVASSGPVTSGTTQTYRHGGRRPRSGKWSARTTPRSRWPAKDVVSDVNLEELKGI